MCVSMGDNVFGTFVFFSGIKNNNFCLDLVLCVCVYCR